MAERIEIGVGLAGQIGYAIDCAMQKGVKDRALVPVQVVRRIMADMCARSEFSHRELHSAQFPDKLFTSAENTRSEAHTSELPSIMRISYAVYCLKKHNHHTTPK